MSNDDLVNSFLASFESSLAASGNSVEGTILDGLSRSPTGDWFSVWNGEATPLDPKISMVVEDFATRRHKSSTSDKLYRKSFCLMDTYKGLETSYKLVPPKVAQALFPGYHGKPGWLNPDPKAKGLIASRFYFTPMGDFDPVESMKEKPRR